MHTGRLTRAPRGSVWFKRSSRPSPALQANSQFHSSKSDSESRRIEAQAFLDGTWYADSGPKTISESESCPSAFDRKPNRLSGAPVPGGDGRLPRVLVPYPIQSRQKGVFHMVPRIADPEAAPDEFGNALRSPHRSVESVPGRSLLRQLAEPRQVFMRQLRWRAAGFWPPAQPLVSMQAVAARPTLHRLNGHAQGPGDRCC